MVLKGYGAENGMVPKMHAAEGVDGVFLGLY